MDICPMEYIEYKLVKISFGLYNSFALEEIFIFIYFLLC
jgi:hypothetical protein